MYISMSSDWMTSVHLRNECTEGRRKRSIMKLLKLLVGKLKKKMNEEEKCGSVPVKHCPMVAKVLDLCCGAYGECSDGVKRLLDVMAETRLQSLGLR